MAVVECSSRKHKVAFVSFDGVTFGLCAKGNKDTLGRSETFPPMVARNASVTFENTSETEPLVCLRYFGPEVNPNALAMGAYRKNEFNSGGIGFCPRIEIRANRANE